MTQANQILQILSDGKPHRSDEFQDRMFGSLKYGLFRLGARIYDLKKRGHNITGWKDKDTHALYWYQLIVPQVFRPSIVLPPARSTQGGEVKQKQLSLI